MTEWLQALTQLAAAERPAVLVTILHVAGSTPREAGTKMVVSGDALHGTIGGGHLELVPAAREITIQDLLRHTSGFTYGVFGKSLVKEEYKKLGIDSWDQTNAEVMKKLGHGK